MNPARSLGTAVIYAIFVDGIWEFHYVYWVGPLIGGILAAVTYRYIYEESEDNFVISALPFLG